MTAFLFALSLFGSDADDADRKQVAAVAEPARSAPSPARRAQAPAPAKIKTPVAPAIAVVPAAKDKLDADAVVGKVQDFYAQTKSLKATFRQTVVNATFGRKTVSDGYVYLKKPGKMRWDYYRKQQRPGKPNVTKSFLSDGDTLWAVFVDNKQYYRKALKDDVLPVAVTFLTGQGDLRRDFDAALDTSGKWGAKDDFVLALTPKKPSAQYKKLWLVVDPKDFRVKQSIVLNTKGDTNQFRFYEPDTTTALDDGKFIFNPKAAKGYRVIEPPK